MFEIFKRVRHKKASLSLSINAIVILVLAIAMLGLGLAFTKTMFKKFQAKLVVPPPDIPATAEEPIVLPTDELTIKHGDSTTFSVNFYNDYNAGVVEPALDCGGTLNPDFYGGVEGITTGNTLTGNECDAGACDVIATKQKVDSGTYKTFKFIVPAAATSTETVTQDVCEVKFCAPDTQGPGLYDATGCFTENEESRQIVIRVT